MLPPVVGTSGAGAGAVPLAAQAALDARGRAYGVTGEVMPSAPGGAAQVRRSPGA
ncbi:hypothetical protein [Streptomyces sp. NPDC093261]|uniref:hypothetical protein n=1 Tax=Streptomyces sp. NPDC093261 TaxID=3366037 RepID=UPI00380CAB5B